MEVLKRVKADPEPKVIPMIVMTSSRAEQDLVSGCGSNLNGQVVKPVKCAVFSDVTAGSGAFCAGISEALPGSVLRAMNQST